MKASPDWQPQAQQAVVQAFYNREAGARKLSTETGAGQCGSAPTMARVFFSVEVEIVMMKISFQQKPYRRNLMETFGATVHASPTNLPNAGCSR